MDLSTRDKLVVDALAACRLDLDCAVQLVAPRPSPRHSIETTRVPWGAPPRFVSLAPGMTVESDSLR